MKYNKVIDSYISHVLELHEVKTIERFHSSIFWTKNGEVIAEIDNSKFFWLRKDIWNDISRMFDLDYDDTQSVIKEWLGQHSNLGGLTPYNLRFSSLEELEQNPNFDYFDY